MVASGMIDLLISLYTFQIHYCMSFSLSFCIIMNIIIIYAARMKLIEKKKKLKMLTMFLMGF